MAKKVEKRYHVWFSWEHEKEERWINDLSRQGLHLTGAGAISSKFERDESVRYTYRIDHQPGLGKGEKWNDYVALYRDAGWEYAGKSGAVWFYFRRPWSPDESPQLYTDRDSIVAYYNRIRRLMVAMFFVNLIILCLNGINLVPRIHSSLWGIVVPVLAIYAAVFLLLGIGIIKIGRKIKKIL
ncbi:DUF2812 domain-containing protein [Paenibacillus rhizovicinus]|uniref:DUF2812 domain-containing protein n=1 Tax=Paenibacillus rhizovicinus TaxID=2704463 RepID=A0A6C0P0M7_9BACL|nr:DUF2812 domain-containing protein [Paenibacillus rhizovicinus]QHW32035.1 DUF2812 domain-containing protein [Paenibacillus rhizovicinus]